MTAIGDAAFLSEVEDFLDSCNLPTLSSTQALPSDDPISADHTSTDSPSSGGDSMPENCVTVVKDARHRVYRKRRRAERENLEEAVEELKLRLAKEPRRLLLMSAWRMVATCQLEKRLVAEAQHRQLRSAVLAQSTLIRAYEGLVPDQVVGVKQFECVDQASITYYPPESLRGGSFDSEFYMSSSTKFHAIYSRVDDVFGRADRVYSTGGAATKELQGGNGQNYFHYIYKQQVPITFDQTCEAWKTTLSHHQQNDQQTHGGLEDTANTVAIKFRVTSEREGGHDGSVLLRVIINHRYEDDNNRMVAAWRTFAEGEEAFAGMYADEIGWAMLTPSAERMESSLLRICARYLPMNFASTATSEQGPVARNFAGIVAGTSTSNADKIARSLQTLRISDNTQDTETN